MNPMFFVPLAGTIGLIFVGILAWWVVRQEPGTARMREIASFINAKELIEEGHFGGKGTETHAAAVIGDTFGDPLKDTAGPSLHILVKLQNIMSITLLPLFIQHGLNLFQ